MHERCTYWRLDRTLAKGLFASRTPEGVAAFVAALDPALTPHYADERGVTLALHRALTDGTLAAEAGEYPLNHAVLGGRPLAAGESATVVLKRPDMCGHIAEALARIKPASIEATWRQCVAAHAELAHRWETSDLAAALMTLANLYHAAASAGEAVLLVRVAA